MKFLYKKALFTIIAACLFINIQNIEAAVTAPAQTTVTKTTASAYTSVSPLDVVNTPAKYLNKNISFTGEFVAYTSLGLDYKPAFKDGTKYIGILIRRPDVTTNTIPLSEMKIFVKREVAEKNVDLEAGDKIKIEGTVFSNALGDPWIDVKTFNALTNKNKTVNKK